MGTESQNDIFVLIGKIDFGKKMQKKKIKTEQNIERQIYICAFISMVSYIGSEKCILYNMEDIFSIYIIYWSPAGLRNSLFINSALIKYKFQPLGIII